MTLKSKADVLPYMISFHPQLGYVLPNGNLRISWSGGGEDGELLDGYVEVAPEYPDYADWLKAINDKDNYLREEKEKMPRNVLSDETNTNSDNPAARASS